MRYTGPRNKAARREGMDLELKTPGSKSHASLMRKINVPPGQHGMKRRRKVSERARQLREKQKLRTIFSVNERQLKQYFATAKRMKGNTETILAELLERRLDNIVFRAGFAPTRAAARQLVNHRHINVNGKLLTIASHEVSKGDVIAFAREESTKIPYIEEAIANKSRIIPEWLLIKKSAATVAQEPTSETVEKQVNMRSVIEYYSR